MSGHTPLPATPIDLPLLPLRDVVVFPHMVIPLFAVSYTHLTLPTILLV